MESILGSAPSIVIRGGTVIELSARSDNHTDRGDETKITYA